MTTYVNKLVDGLGGNEVASHPPLHFSKIGATLRAEFEKIGIVRKFRRHTSMHYPACRFGRCGKPNETCVPRKGMSCIRLAGFGVRALFAFTSPLCFCGTLVVRRRNLSWATWRSRLVDGIVSCCSLPLPLTQTNTYDKLFFHRW